MSKNDGERPAFGFSIASNSWDTGSVTVSLAFGEYGKVGYRSISVSLVCRTGLDGSVVWAPRYDDDDDTIARLKSALGKDAGKWLVEAVTRIRGVKGVDPSAEEGERDARYAKEAEEEEEQAAIAAAMRDEETEGDSARTLGLD